MSGGGHTGWSGPGGHSFAQSAGGFGGSYLPNTDAEVVFGRNVIGADEAYWADFATFTHYDLRDATTGRAGLSVNSAGACSLNAATGQNLTLQRNGSGICQLNTTPAWLMPAGTAATPGWAYLADTDLGWYRVGADDMAAVCGSSAVRLRMNATGVGFFTTTPAAQQVSAANLTNNVATGGTDDTIANYTDLTIYANDSAAIRNNIYQLARKLKQVNDALRLYGLLT